MVSKDVNSPQGQFEGDANKIGKEVVVEKIVEVIKEVIVEKPVEVIKEIEIVVEK